MKMIYCLSGLGVDQSAFELFTPNSATLVHIPWIVPEKNESLSDYAHRLFESANLPLEYSLLGVSFGGMIAQEFAKIRTPKALFLVSTISNSKELSFPLRIGGKIGIHKLLPSQLLKRANFITYFLFGAEKPEHKALLKRILKQTNSDFLKWAMNAIIRWENKVEENGTTIHGGKDRILPRRAESIDFWIPTGGHFMIATHGKEISKIVEDKITSDF